jgi:hypothetical protein
MGTDNPKVSAYVPQAIKNRLNQFRKERNNIPESQAVIIILAEYFEMTEVLGRSSGGVGGVTLVAMQAIESRLASFMELVESRLAALEDTSQKLAGVIVVHDKLLDDNQSSSSIQSELPIEIQPQSEPQKKEESAIQINLLSEPLEGISPIPGIKLSKLRFGLSESRISAMRQKMLKQKMSLEEFTQWTKDNDPDRIPWKFIESPLKGYVPAEELSSEQKSSLLKWIKENLL